MKIEIISFLWETIKRLLKPKVKTYIRPIGVELYYTDPLYYNWQK